MNTKPTLTIEGDVIERAKRYAKSKGRSLSSIIESYLEALTMEEGQKIKKQTPIVKSLRGSFKLPKGRNYKDLLTEALTEKYLKNE